LPGSRRNVSGTSRPRQLRRIGLEHNRWLDPAYDRRHSIAGHGFVVGQAPERLHAIARQGDLFLGFAQRGSDRVGVLGLDAAAGKADLSWMVGQVGAALGKQHRQAVRAIDQRDQDGRGRGHAFAARQAASVGKIGRRHRRRSLEPLAQPCLLLGGR
jgi:hypothetical protein